MGQDLKVVMIDDNKDLLFTMETFLQRNGFEVHTAEDGQTGLDLIKKECPDVILLDIMMETLFSGFEVCKQVRADKELMDTPIIGISAMGDELDINYSQWPDYDYFRPDTFMEKPIDKQRLLQLIPEVIQKAQKRKRDPKWKKEMQNDWAQKASQKKQT
ncbi:MAG: response regulator [Deltaproteobacteria bacterium]|jgi:DNA-binding response OmpR family regulator|nr:response regulator [Deltaproteobacteria bacterium]MBW2518113.1 response regulator [Deltaproteobacteria bacterium]